MNKSKYLKEKYCLPADALESYGDDKFKIKSNTYNLVVKNNLAKLVVVTSINPTKAGEGKTTVSIGLAAGLEKLGKSAILSLREPSLGPFFGLKGGATGSGMTYLTPPLDINLHFTGDIHAVTSANNLISALIDAHIFHQASPKIKEVCFSRSIDINDRALRDLSTPGGAGFILSAASEIMAILALSKDFSDMRKRIANIIIGIDENNEFIYLKEIGGTDAVSLLLKDAIKPNIVLTNEGVGAIIHTGCFANIAHGCSSVIGTNLGLRLADYVITEAGFGSDLGLEKFVNIKQPLLDKQVDLVVLVLSIRSIKEHDTTGASNPLEKLASGIVNVQKHIDNIKLLGLDFVIAINYMNDNEDEVVWLEKWAKNKGYSLSIAKGYTQGAKGMVDLAQMVSQKEASSSLRPLYDLNDYIETKVEKIAKNIYGAINVEYSKKALRKMALFGDFKYSICIAKTPHSFTDDPSIKGAPNNHTLHVADISINNGAKMLIVKTKGILLLPGLSKDAYAYSIKINDDGEIVS